MTSKNAIYSRRQAELIECMVEARKAAGLSQEALAQLLGLGSQQAVSLIETGRQSIGVVELHGFCDALGLSMVDFIATYVERAAQRERPRKRR